MKISLISLALFTNGPHNASHGFKNILQVLEKGNWSPRCQGEQYENLSNLYFPLRFHLFFSNCLQMAIIPFPRVLKAN